MSAVQEIVNPDEALVRRFTEYLNGPKGKVVLQALDEGESFLCQTSDRTFKVTKSHGRAVVELRLKRF